MKIINLKLYNFRNYQNLEIDFNNHLNYFVGKNAQGKTNIVEALYILSTIKSFRNSKLVDCIKDSENKAVIELIVIYNSGIKKHIKFIINRDSENEYYVNENKITSKKDMFGWLYSIVFSPDELKLVKGSPDIRREFLDTDICQVSKAYTGLISRYDTLLLSRNKLLKFSKNLSSLYAQLDIFEDQMALVGGQITLARQNFIEKLNNYASTIMQKLSNCKETLQIEYIGIEGKTRENKTENFKKLLKDSRSKDLELGYSSVGPQRDDIKFIVNNKEVKPFASQGQQRSVVLALKIAELMTIKNEKEDPILILDDVFSELDKIRQKNLIELVGDNQVFITSTTNKTSISENGKNFRVNNGKIKIR